MLEAPPIAMAQPGRGGAPPTFAACAAWYIDLHRHVWTGPKQVAKWEQALTRHAYPHIGNMGVDEITTDDVLATLTPLWATKHDTGLRLRQQVCAILEWATAQGYRNGSNPADGPTIFQSLPRREQTKPHRSLHHSEVPAALQQVKWSNSFPSARFSFRLMVLTATRPGDVRFAEWPEIDWEQRVWTVPAARASQTRRIPLSSQVVQILDDACYLSGLEGSLIFPAERSRETISDATLLRLLWRLGIPASPGGFRHSFRDWCDDNGVPPELAEAGLSPVAGRADMLRQMRTLLQDWADYCCALDRR